MSPPLVLCSPAKSLGLRVCHSFCACVRQSLSSLQRPEPEKRLFRQLPFSSATSELPQQELLYPTRKSIKEHLFSHLLHALIVHSVTLHFLNRISNPHLPLVSLHTGHFHKHRSTNRKFFLPNPTPTKTCAKPLCILQRSQVVQFLSISCFPPRSTRSRLATFLSYLLSLATHTPVS